MRNTTTGAKLSGVLMKAYAHKGASQEGQSLGDHLSRTAELAGKFASAFGAEVWGRLAGYWHDVGKFSTAFQEYLLASSESEAHAARGSVDHSTAGAQYLAQRIEVWGHLLAYVIAGHHGGLPDGRAESGGLDQRLTKKVPPWQQGLSELPPVPREPPLPKPLQAAVNRRDGFGAAFFVRMLFSCLVDADYLDTESFLNPSQAAIRATGFPSIGTLAERFFQSLEKWQASQPDTEINRLRRRVREDCERAAELPPGFFTLTVPTGGGKTLSAMAFALRHAQRHDLRRIVYVAPFTTIIEQNADVLRQHLGGDALIEHHCHVEIDEDSPARLATENWDAPVIVTTSVQFYESLFSNKTSRCRKLHRLARSVIILDEAQTMPVDYLKPCLRVLDELVQGYGCTVVLCTATQPEIRRRPDFEIGLSDVREIMPDPEGLHRVLKRVRVERLGRQTDEELKERILREDRVLCIVNTTRQARLLFEKIGPLPWHFHLSARMCPAHRRVRLWQIRRALKSGLPCRVVSTQVVEAGVDLDFPVVYRALAGLDSITQAAGRCNRHNTLSQLGRTYVFTTEHIASERYFADTANVASQVMELYPDPLDLQANEHFFRLYYWDQKSRWDSRHILDDFLLQKDDPGFPFNFSFATAAAHFHLIDDQAYGTVIIPWGREGRRLCEALRNMPTREFLRAAQRYAVQVWRDEWDLHVSRGDIRLISDNLGILESPETHYNVHTGLNLDAEGPGSYFA